MRALTAMMATSVALAAASVSDAAPVQITNAGFEVAGNGSALGNWVLAYNNDVQGWTSAWFNNPGSAITWGGQNTTYDAPHSRNPGQDHVMTIGQNEWTCLSQRPSVNSIMIEAGTYTLGLDINGATNGFSKMSAGFDWAAPTALDAVTIIETDNFASGTSDGTWSTVTAATLVVPEGSTLIGQQLGFFVQGFEVDGGGNQVLGSNNWPHASLDNVTLDFVAVPEPTVLCLLGGAIPLMLVRKRKAASPEWPARG